MLNPKQHDQVLNLSQDICVAVSGTPTPKHVGTALHVLKQTRSKETITLLNRLGNSISYQDAQRYITTIAEATEQQTKEDGFFTPSHLSHGRFTHCAIDNLDFHEHTKDGTTMHGTTHAIYQYLTSDEQMASGSAKVPIVKSRKSASVNVEKFTTKESRLTLKDRQKSRSLCGIQLQSQHAEKSMDLHHNTLWHLMGMPGIQAGGMEDELIHLTWNAFNKFLIEDHFPATVIGYGPFFPQ